MSSPRRTATITAVGKYLPEKVVTNADLEESLDTTDEWIRSRTGIHQRHMVSNGETTSDMTVAAIRDLMEKYPLDVDKIDCIIVGTVTPDMLFPSTAAIVQQKLGASNAWGFDLSAACSGFLFGLDTGTRFIESGRYEKVLVVGADAMSAVIDPTDRSTAILFGDGAGVVLLEPCEDGSEGIMDSLLRIDGSGGDYLYMIGGGSRQPATAESVAKGDHFLRQDGRAVYKAAVKGMADISAAIAQRNGLKAENIRLFIPHQANQRIIDASAERLGLAAEQVLSNVAMYANTTAGTIPLGICDAVEDNLLQPGDNVLLAAFGAGFTWGGIYIKWGHTV